MMIWRSISRALYRHRRNAWHFVFLGWSWSAEQYHKPTFHPLLRKATSPSGTHAYVMSQMGVERARSSLMALDTLFQRPIDVSPTLSRSRSMNSEEPTTPPFWKPDSTYPSVRSYLSCLSVTSPHPISARHPQRPHAHSRLRVLFRRPPTRCRRNHGPRNRYRRNRRDALGRGKCSSPHVSFPPAHHYTTQLPPNPSLLPSPFVSLFSTRTWLTD